MIMRYLFLILITLMLMSTGCVEPTASTTASSNNSKTANQDRPSNSLIDETLTAGGGAELPTASSGESANSGNTANAAAAPQPTTEQVPAAVGVGKSGRKLDQYQNDSVQKIISTPAREYFRVKERVVFEIAIPHALDLYKAEHGEGPRSHDDFMRDIIEFNDIKLPELPPGQRYIYNPETEELMVERPVAQ